jgi:putative RNA 2'-phosphotransferase
MIRDLSKLMVLSKFMSLVLRHKPLNFGLTPDQYGFVSMEDLLCVLRNRYRDVQCSDIEAVLANCPKSRFEIKEQNIRARYGHSIDVKLDKEPVQPPESLFHGTSSSREGSILREGIKPMNRKYVHLSKNKHEAWEIGRRKTKNPIILTVKAREAFQKGMKFYDMGGVVLTQMIPAEFVYRGK